MTPEQIDQKAIPDEVLNEMVALCKGDHTSLLERAKRYRQENAHEILFSRFFAEKGLLKKHGILQEVKEDNKGALSDIKKVLNAATELKTMLTAIPDLFSPPESPLSGLAMRMEIYMYAFDDWQEYKNEGNSKPDKRLREWSDFLYLLDHHISVFEHIQSDLMSLNKRGRPNTVKMLEGFIEQIAKMYIATTGKKFTVCEYGDKDCFTEGMHFAQKAMDVLRVSASSNHFKYRDFLASMQYSEENFHSACDYVRQSLNILGKNKEEIS